MILITVLLHVSCIGFLLLPKGVPGAAARTTLYGHSGARSRGPGLLGPDRLPRTGAGADGLLI